jgi:cytochrome c biogenesis protein CcmG, thiol:disulfide interchange protein DsbE
MSILRLTLLGFLLSPVACSTSRSPAAPSVETQASGVSVGGVAPELEAALFRGEGSTTLASARGKVVVLDFWATYCDPCKKSFPAYQQLVDRFKGDLVVIAVTVDDPANAGAREIDSFLRDTGARFPVLWDKDQSVMGKYRIRKMPTSFIIDRAGVVRHVHAGYESGDEAQVAQEIEALLR